jgi:hypothetical protein
MSPRIGCAFCLFDWTEFAAGWFSNSGKIIRAGYAPAFFL